LGVIAAPTYQAAATAFHAMKALTQKSLMAGAQPMSSNGEDVTHDAVDREEPNGLVL